MTDSGRLLHLDRSNTNVAFKVRWFGLLTIRGRFDSCKGLLHLPADGLESATIDLDVEAASVRTGVGLRDRHLRGPRFLDSKRHPLISFGTTRVSRTTGGLGVEGKLTLRNVEQFVIARAAMNNVGGRSDDQVAISASFVVSRRRHGVGQSRGLARLNPLLFAISEDVAMTVTVTVPSTQLLPTLFPALSPSAGRRGAR